jgi:hypothetical protein
MIKGSGLTDRKKKQKSQQLSDRLISKVAKGKMSYAEARKQQDSADAAKRRTKKVGRKTSAGSASTVTKRKYNKAKFKRDRHGNLVAY